MSFEEKLIGEVQKYPVLYQKSAGGNKNVSVKCRIWNTIGKELGVSDEVCQKKWKSLRDRYSREKNKLLMPSGSGSQISNPNDWEHWEALGFLKDYIRPRNSRTNFIAADEQGILGPSSSTSIIQVDKEIEIGDTDNDFQLDCSQLQDLNKENIGKRTCSETTNSSEFNSEFSATPNKKKKNNDFSVKLVETMEVFQNHILNRLVTTPIPPPVEETANSAFMKSATIILSFLQPLNQVRARGDIMKYLCDLQMEELNSTQ